MKFTKNSKIIFSVLGVVAVLAVTLFFVRYRILVPAKVQTSTQNVQVYNVDRDRLLVLYNNQAVLINKKEEEAFLIGGDNAVHVSKYIIWKRDRFKGILLNDRVKLNERYDFAFLGESVRLTLPTGDDNLTQFTIVYGSAPTSTSPHPVSEEVDEASLIEYQAVKVGKLLKYKNNTLGFEFLYPQNVKVYVSPTQPETSPILIREPSLKTEWYVSDRLAMIEPSDTSFWKYDANLKNYIKTDTDSEESLAQYFIPLQTDGEKKYYNCTKPFFGNQSIPSYRFAWGEGGDMWIYHSILVDDKNSLGIETTRADFIGGDSTVQKESDDRAKKQDQLEKTIFSTLRFYSVKPIVFLCEPWKN